MCHGYYKYVCSYIVGIDLRQNLTSKVDPGAVRVTNMCLYDINELQVIFIHIFATLTHIHCIVDLKNT